MTKDESVKNSGTQRRMPLGLALGLPAITLLNFFYFNASVGPDPAWGNFWGALTVALGGVFGAQSEYSGRTWLKAAGWASVVVGGAAIAGAALKATAG